MTLYDYTIYVRRKVRLRICFSFFLHMISASYRISFLCFVCFTGSFAHHHRQGIGPYCFATVVLSLIRSLATERGLVAPGLSGNTVIELDDGKTLQENPIFDGKKPWFPVNFPLNQSSDTGINWHQLVPGIRRKIVISLRISEDI